MQDFPISVMTAESWKADVYYIMLQKCKFCVLNNGGKFPSKTYTNNVFDSVAYAIC